MNASARLMSRSDLAAAPAMAARSPARARRKLAARWPGVWLLMGFLLAVSAPAHGFDGQEQSPPLVDDLGLHSSGVPTSANWVVLDATGIAAWRAEGDTRWQRFIRGEVLPAGCEIETGSDGEVTLVAGGDQLTIAPQGRLLVPIAQPGQDRRLRHERGRILVQIEFARGQGRPGRHAAAQSGHQGHHLRGPGRAHADRVARARGRRGGHDARRKRRRGSRHRGRV